MLWKLKFGMKWITGTITEHLGPLTHLVEVRTTQVEVEKTISKVEATPPITRT